MLINAGREGGAAAGVETDEDEHETKVATLEEDAIPIDGREIGWQISVVGIGAGVCDCVGVQIGSMRSPVLTQWANAV